MEITRNGQPVAMVIAPDPIENKMRELVKAGVIPADLLRRQAALLRRLRGRRIQIPAGQPTFSDTLIQMRSAERW